jgi:hypothetical protein
MHKKIIFDAESSVEAMYSKMRYGGRKYYNRLLKKSD